MRITIVAFLCLFGILNHVRLEAGEYLTERPPFAGVWVNTFGRAHDFSAFHQFMAGEADRLRWDKLQLGPDQYDFSEIRTTLERARDARYYWYCELWTGHFAAPAWLFDSGVPRVEDVKGETYPYYLDEDYSSYQTAFFNSLACYIAELPDDLRDRIAFMQVGFGSTGDRQLYKNRLRDARYEIGSDSYVSYMKASTIAWFAAFNAHDETADIRFLWNIDDYEGSDRTALQRVPDGKLGEMLYGDWMKRNYDCQLRKQQFTIAIGYMDVNERTQDSKQRKNFFGTAKASRWEGNPEFVRGEHNDPKWARTPMALQAPLWHYYWTAVSSVDKGLDAWESKPEFVISGKYNEAFEFSHRYSFYKEPGSSPVAFVAMRDVLDYSDEKRFPPSRYGAPLRNNRERLGKILEEFALYGATNEDSEAVINLSASEYLLSSKGLNDCVWNVIDRNYRRHMFQIDPNETSVGWWRVGSTDQPYGRFARAFEHRTGKDAMYFKFVDGFLDDGRGPLEVKIIYYDELPGSTWELRYENGGPSMTVAHEVTCVGDGRWKSVVVTLPDAVCGDNGRRVADLALVNTDPLDDKFHLIEVRKLPEN